MTLNLKREKHRMNTQKLIQMTTAVLLVGASMAGHAQQCESWQRVDTPSPGSVRNFFVDAEEANGTVYALMFSTDSAQLRPPGEYHVLRRDGNTWTDLGGPDDEALGPFVTEYQALGVAPDGTLYVGGWFFPTSIGRDAAPAMAVGDGAGNWSTPAEIQIPDSVVEPTQRRAAEIYSVEVAPDGTVIAAGSAQGFGGGQPGIDDDVPLFLVNDGSGWVETGVEPGQDWPGGSGDGDFTVIFDSLVISNDDIWMAGRHSQNGTTSGGLILHWDGAMLNVIEEPSVSDGGLFLLRQFNAIDGDPGNALHAVGSNTFNQTGEPIGTLALFDGLDWELLPTPWLTDVVEDLATASDIVVAADGTAWASTVFGAAQTPFYDGSEWSLRPFVPAQDAAEGARIRHMAEATDDGSLWGFGWLNPDAGALQSYAITCGDVIFASGFE